MNRGKTQHTWNHPSQQKEILFEIEHDDKSVHNFIHFCRSNNYGSPKDIELFEKEYNDKLAIRWYTRAPFIYLTLNRALRTFQTHIIPKMAFVIFDLHTQIEQLYQDQRSNYNGKPFTVYRGQALSKTDFEKLQQTKGGLISFNNFLSTTVDPQVSRFYGESNSTAKDMVGILFIITVDPNISSAPFASIKSFSDIEDEDEILFSMHTIFRIDDVKQSCDHNGIYEVKLRLTADDDEQLRILTRYIAKEIKGDTGQKRLGNLLVRIGQSDQAEELYNTLLEQTCDEQEKVYYYRQLGYVKYTQEDYNAYLWYNLIASQIEQEISPSGDNISMTRFDVNEHTRLIVFYNNNYINDENCSESLFNKRALEVFEKDLTSDNSQLRVSSDDIDKVSNDTETGSQSLWLNKKLLEIREKTLPPNHFDLAMSYHSIGVIYHEMHQHSDALQFYEKALPILEQNLPSNHPSFAPIYNNIGMVYYHMKEYSKALTFCKKALDICQRSLPSNHSNLINSYESVGRIYQQMEQYLEAISYYEKAFEGEQEPPPSDYSQLAICYYESAKIFESKRKYTETLSFYTKALQVCEKILPPDSLDIVLLYTIIGKVYCEMEDYSKALAHFEHVLSIFKDSTSEGNSFKKNIQDYISYAREKLTDQL